MLITLIITAKGDDLFMDPIEHHRERMRHHLRQAERFRALSIAHRHDRMMHHMFAQREHFHRMRAHHHRSMMHSLRR